MRGLYEKVFRRLQQVDFAAIYPKFHLFPFALYDQDTVYLWDKEIPRTDDFYGNTKISFEGQTIAIWNVSEYDRTHIDILVANMVHEMFHAFQNDTDMIKEYPNDLKILSYPCDMDNYFIKQNENQMLANAMDMSPEEKANALAMIRASRVMRKQKIGDFVLQEELIEQHEGLAECCGTLALKQLRPDLYQERIAEYQNILRKGDILLDIRRISYYSGALLRILEREIREEEIPFATKLQKALQQKEQLLKDFFETERAYTEADAFICGYDPMNQLRVGNQLLAKNIIWLNIGGETVKLDGPVVLKMKEGSTNLLEGYFV